MRNVSHNILTLKVVLHQIVRRDQGTISASISFKRLFKIKLKTKTKQVNPKFCEKNEIKINADCVKRKKIIFEFGHF